MNFSSRLFFLFLWVGFVGCFFAFIFLFIFKYQKGNKNGNNAA